VTTTGEKIATCLDNVEDFGDVELQHVLNSILERNDGARTAAASTLQLQLHDAILKTLQTPADTLALIHAYIVLIWGEDMDNDRPTEKGYRHLKCGSRVGWRKSAGLTSSSSSFLASTTKSA